MRSRLGTKPDAVTIDLSHVDYMDSSGLAPLIEALLTGRLERLDEIDYGGGVRVEARLSAELTNLRTGVIAWTGNASETSKIDQRNVNSIVSEMSTALQISVHRLLASMQEQVSTREAAPR